MLRAFSHSKFLNGNKLMCTRTTGLDNFLSLIEEFKQLLGNFSPTWATSPPGVAFGFCPGTEPRSGDCGAGNTAVVFKFSDG